MQTEFEGIKKPRQETAEKYRKAKELMETEGLSANKAVDKVGMAYATFVAHKERFDSVPKKKKIAPKKTFIDLPMHNHTQTSDENMVVVVCKASQLKNILDGLK